MLRNMSLTDSLPSSLVDIAEKKRSNLFTWRGQFSPQLIEHLLEHYASEGDVVFDPFLGSGTVLLESAMLGLSASGCEINPAAVSFAKVYELINRPRCQVEKSLSAVEQLISPFMTDLELFGGADLEQFEPTLTESVAAESNDTTRLILLALITGMDFGAKKLDVKRISSVWRTLRTNIKNLPSSDSTVTCYQADARQTPLENNSVDFVVTSPPYINVFNYHQNYRKSVEATGVDVLAIARSEIGANRKFRQNRFLTVVQYCMDMAQVFGELRRVCKHNAKIIFIVGRESNVRKTAFENAKLITSVAEVCGFELMSEQHRCFTNKFGASIYEEILRFSPTSNVSEPSTHEARKIGQDALRKALSYCELETRVEIEDAIEKSERIDCSPIFVNEELK